MFSNSGNWFVITSIPSSDPKDYEQRQYEKLMEAQEYLVNLIDHLQTNNLPTIWFLGSTDTPHSTDF